MIGRAAAMQEGEERDNLVRMLANQMKKLMIAVNKDGVDDAKIFKDLAEISEGAIRISPEDMPLHEYVIPQQVTGKKKKKK